MAKSQNINPDEGMENFGLGGGFGFTGMGVERLAELATEFSLVDIVIDVTGSTAGFADELHRMLVTVVQACKKSPRSDNLLVRVSTFSTSVGGVNELHGYKPLSEIDPQAYRAFKPDGLTPLYDAAYTAVGAQVKMGADLRGQELLANGIVFIITDGDDNHSTATPKMIAQAIKKVGQDEQLESMVSVLIGINAGQYERELKTFQQEAGITQYIDAGQATAGNLAKLAAFVSQSVSSQSQSLGTGGPSQNIAATI